MYIHRLPYFNISHVYTHIKITILYNISHTAGSMYVPLTRSIFEVKKGVGQESSGSQTSEREIISVTIFRELRGRSEVVAFLSPSPVRGTCIYMYVYLSDAL